MSNSIESQIKERIQAFVSELDALVRRSTLEALRGLLEGGSAPARRGPGRPRGSGRGSTDVDAAGTAIAAHVRSNDGQSVSEIAAATGTQLKTAKKAIIKLLAAGQLKKSGQRRGTRYHAGSGRAPTLSRGKRGKRRGRRAKAA